MITPLQYQEMTRRVSRKPLAEGDKDALAVLKESDLHNDIMAACRLRGWQYLHGSMAEATHRTLGEPDFILLADRGRVIFIECKRRGGKLSPAQQAFKYQAEKNGHVIHVIFSMHDFYKVIEQ